MSVWSWLRLTVCLWLLRKMIKVTGWLLVVAVAAAVWPVTLVAVAGFVAAWLRGWPPVRLGRAATLALPMTAVWLAAEARQRAWPAIARDPVRDWAHGWQHLTGFGEIRAFLLVAPVTIPAGLGLAALAWTWRIYAMTTGIGGWLASAPITFDIRQWKRQVRTAKGRTAAPGSVPLLARGARIPVGGTIRAIGHRWHPVFAVPHSACARHMVIVGATGSGKTNLMICKDLFIILDKAAAQGYIYLVTSLDSNVRLPPNLSVLCPFPAVRTGRYPDFSLTYWLP